jgi:hypothetical protein
MINFEQTERTILFGWLAVCKVNFYQYRVKSYEKLPCYNFNKIKTRQDNNPLACDSDDIWVIIH